MAKMTTFRTTYTISGKIIPQAERLISAETPNWALFGRSLNESAEMLLTICAKSLSGAWLPLQSSIINVS